MAKGLISIDDLDLKEIEEIFKSASFFKKNPISDSLKDKIITLLFFEPSTRTFSSFSAAAKRLGAQTLEFQNPNQTTSTVKGETLEDTARILENNSDLIVIRHPEIGAPLRVANTVKVPVINAGDGAGEHPTQALLDLFTIYEEYGKIDSVKGLICADAKYGRGVHSLLKILGKFKDVTIYLLSPEELKLSKEQVDEYTNSGLNLVEIHSEDEIPTDCDFWYWSRIQKERFKENKKIKMFRLTQKLINKKARKDMIIMHILPRIDEVDVETDSDPRTIYMNRQPKNGLFIRMALMERLLK